MCHHMLTYPLFAKTKYAQTCGWLCNSSSSEGIVSPWEWMLAWQTARLRNNQWLFFLVIANPRIFKGMSIFSEIHGTSEILLRKANHAEGAPAGAFLHRLRHGIQPSFGLLGHQGRPGRDSHGRWTRRCFKHQFYQEKKNLNSGSNMKNWEIHQAWNCEKWRTQLWDLSTKTMTI